MSTIASDEAPYLTLLTGRNVVWHRNGESVSFQPPRAISQITALASCYSRFRHTSKYISHIDIDEFFVFSPKTVQETLQLSQAPRNLFDLSEAVFSKNSALVSIKFDPVTFFYCNVTTGKEHTPFNAMEYPHQGYPPHNITSTPLPRLGTWQVSEHSKESYESKLIMRADAVGMFYIHYISLIEVGPWSKSLKDSSMRLPVTSIALYHYKHPQYLSNNILEGIVPISREARYWDCEDEIRVAKIGVDYHAKISYEIHLQLKRNYIKKMKNITSYQNKV